MDRPDPVRTHETKSGIAPLSPSIVRSMPPPASQHTVRVATLPRRRRSPPPHARARTRRSDACSRSRSSHLERHAPNPPPFPLLAHHPLLLVCAQWNAPALPPSFPLHTRDRLVARPPPRPLLRPTLDRLDRLDAVPARALQTLPRPHPHVRPCPLTALARTPT